VLDRIYFAAPACGRISSTPMATPEPGTRRDVALLSALRFARMAAHGGLAVVLALYLAERGLDANTIGALFGAILAGDTALSLVLTTRADTWGRRRTLAAGAVLMCLAGLAFAQTADLTLLFMAGTLGVLSPGGQEVGPFLAVEQAALAQLAPGAARTRVFAWHHLAGAAGSAAGSLAAGIASHALLERGWPALAAYRAIVLAYAGVGAMLLVGACTLGRTVEVTPTVDLAPRRGALGLHRSRGVVLRLSLLFGLDAFGGGFVLQGFLAYWFVLRHGADPATLGWLFFGANLASAASALSAASLARKIGLVPTMVFTHLPSNLMLMAIPLMPDLGSAIGLLLARYTISQMDVPTRQAYMMAIVDPDERAAAAGVTGVARSLGVSLAPYLCGHLLARPALSSAPFFVAGTLKVAYDLLLYRAFACVPAPRDGSDRGDGRGSSHAR